MVGHAFDEATGKKEKPKKNDVSDRDVVVMGSGNLGLVYLMEERRRLTMEEIDERHPDANGLAKAIEAIMLPRLRSMAEGLVGRDPDGRRTLIPIDFSELPTASTLRRRATASGWLPSPPIGSLGVK